jgi:hypothetical protein
MSRFFAKKLAKILDFLRKNDSKMTVFADGDLGDFAVQ